MVPLARPRDHLSFSTTSTTRCSSSLPQIPLFLSFVFYYYYLLLYSLIVFRSSSLPFLLSTLRQLLSGEALSLSPPIFCCPVCLSSNPPTTPFVTAKEKKKKKSGREGYQLHLKRHHTTIPPRIAWVCVSLTYPFSRSILEAPLSLSPSPSLSTHATTAYIYRQPGSGTSVVSGVVSFVLVLEMQFKSSLFFLLVAIDLTLTVAVLDPLLLRGREVEKG